MILVQEVNSRFKVICCLHEMFVIEESVLEEVCGMFNVVAEENLITGVRVRRLPMTYQGFQDDILQMMRNGFHVFVTVYTVCE